MPPSDDKLIKIEKINLLSFGRFKNYSITLKDGLNVIYGKNESGKSTIQLFLKAMLYGFPSRKRSGDALKERERAIPFGETMAEGTLVLYAGGRRIEIYRRFGKTPAGDRLEVRDEVSGQKIPEYNENNVGERILGMPVEVFEKTLWIRQNEVVIGGRNDELTKRMMNLKTTGDEKVSAAAALEKMSALRRELKAKDGRSAKGRIDILLDRLEECRREKYDLATQLAQTENIRDRLLAANTELENVNKEISVLEAEQKEGIEYAKTSALRDRIRQIEECDRRLEEIYKSQEYRKSKELNEQEVTSAVKLERELSGQEAVETSTDADEKLQSSLNAQRRAGMMLGGGVALSVVVAIAMIFLLAFGINVVLLAIFSVLLVIGIAFVVLSRSVINKNKYILQMLEAERSLQNQEKERQLTVQAGKRAELATILERFGVSNADELSVLYTTALGIKERIKSLEDAKRDFLAGEDADELVKRSRSGFDKIPRGVDAIELELKGKRKRQMDLIAEIKTLDGKMAYEAKITRIPADIDTEINAVVNELSECERQLLVIDEAEGAIKEAAESWRAETLPLLNEKVTEIAKRIIADRYDGVKVSEEYKLRISSQSELFDAEYLSFGTYEQMYLSLRLAVAELIGEAGILFLDDILTAYDDERAENTLEYLCTLSGNWQILMFSCHLSDKENAEKRRVNTITIQ